MSGKSTPVVRVRSLTATLLSFLIGFPESALAQSVPEGATYFSNDTVSDSIWPLPGGAWPSSGHAVQQGTPLLVPPNFGNALEPTIRAHLGVVRLAHSGTPSGSDAILDVVPLVEHDTGDRVRFTANLASGRWQWCFLETEEPPVVLGSCGTFSGDQFRVVAVEVDEPEPRTIQRRSAGFVGGDTTSVHPMMTLAPRTGPPGNVLVSDDTNAAKGAVGAIWPTVPFVLPAHLRTYQATVTDYHDSDSDPVVLEVPAVRPVLNRATLWPGGWWLVAMGLVASLGVGMARTPHRRRRVARVGLVGLASVAVTCAHPAREGVRGTVMFTARHWPGGEAALVACSSSIRGIARAVHFAGSGVGIDLDADVEYFDNGCSIHRIAQAPDSRAVQVFVGSSGESDERVRGAWSGHRSRDGEGGSAPSPEDLPDVGDSELIRWKQSIVRPGRTDPYAVLALFFDPVGELGDPPTHTYVDRGGRDADPRDEDAFFREVWVVGEGSCERRILVSGARKRVPVYGGVCGADAEGRPLPGSFEIRHRLVDAYGRQGAWSSEVVVLE